MHLDSARILILASSSPRRQELIQSLRHPFKIRVSDVTEEVENGMSPDQIVETLALRKAHAVAEQMRREEPHGIVIGSDTIVVIGNRVLGKPEDAADAAEMLGELQGKEHSVYSGVACIDLVSGRRIVRHRITKVRMKPMDAQTINRYIATGEPMDKAGSYGIQGLGATLVEGIDGCYFNVVGLPLSLLGDMLGEMGIEVI